MTPSDSAVMISTLHDDDPYPSGNNHQTQDAEIKIIAQIDPPASGETIHFEVEDLPDFSSYVAGQDNDNKDLQRPGAFSPTDPSQITTTAVTEANGQASVILYITNRYAGDNYMVRAWTEDMQGQPLSTNWTGLLTAMKRIYVEKDRMFRRGGLLEDGFGGTICTEDCPLDEPVDTNCCNRVSIYDWHNIYENDHIAIFDASSPYEFMHEEAYIKSIQPGATPDVDLVYLKTGLAFDAPNANLSGTYVHSPYPDFSSGCSAGIGVIDDGFYDTDISFAQIAFADAYVDIKELSDGSSAVPYLPPEFFGNCTAKPEGTCTNAQITCPSYHPLAIAQRMFARIWFSKDADQSNIIQLIGAGRTIQYLDCTICGGNNPMSMFAGLAIHVGHATQQNGDTDTKLILVMIQAIEDLCANPSQNANHIQDTVTHELGHQFFVNGGHEDKHDCRCSWDNNPNLPECPTNDPGTCDVDASQTSCVMCPKRDNFNILHRFCADDLICGDTNCPNGAPGCCEALQPSTECLLPGNGSIRQLYDPLLP